MKPPPLTDEQKCEWLRLIRSGRVGPSTFRRLINNYGGAREALAALPNLMSKSGCGPNYLLCSRERAEAEMEAAQRAGLTLVALGDADFPPMMAQLDPPPPLLWAAGDLSLLTRPMLAAVGSRQASAIGLKFTTQLCRELGAHGWTIVSGLARGADAAAHRAALDTGTAAIVAGGADVIYPPENEDLYCALRERGLIMSEMPPGFIAKGHDFPRRNRLIAAIAHAVIVIEAAQRSGTLVTARYAAEFGRDVFAVPGSPLDPRTQGTNRLIRDGAVLLTSAQDILDEIAPRLGGDIADRRKNGLSENSMSENGLSENGAPSAAALRDRNGGHENKREGKENDDDRLAPARPPDEDVSAHIMNALSMTPVEIDDLIRQSGLSPATIHSALLELELAGRIVYQSGTRVSRLE